MYELEIIAASKANNLPELQRLIALGANVNARDKDEATPLMHATSLECIKILLFAGANPLLNDMRGWTASKCAYESNDLPRQKLLVIAEAKARCLIEVKDTDKEQVIIYRLITTLLYESSRHNWDSYPCSKIREYITCLDPKYKIFSNKNQFIELIKQAETEHNTFFGSYLSDDSDSDEERLFTQKSAENKKKSHDFGERIRQLAQVDSICYQRQSGNNRSGSLKLSEVNPSTMFDLQKRIQISRSEFIDHPEIKEKIQQDLDKLNAAFKEHYGDEAKFRQAIANIETQFVVAQYRGITHLTTKWNKPARKAHRDLDEINKPVFSHAVYKAMGVHQFSSLLEMRLAQPNFDELATKIAIQVKEILLSFKADRPCSYNGYTFNNLADLLQQAYSTDYHGFHDLISSNKDLRDLLINHANPFISTGDIPYHSAKYAFGMKPYAGHEWERLRPRWQANGRAERPYSGKLYVSLHPITDYIKNDQAHLVSLVWQGRIQLNNLIVAERETSFYGYFPANRVIGHYKAKYPSFKGDYKQIFLYKYGMDRNLYVKFQTELQTYQPHTPSHRNFKKLLGEWLCSYYEARMINKAKYTAAKNNQVLVYRDKDGLFSLTPPIDTPTRNGVDEAIKTPVKEQRNARKQHASPDKKNITSVELPPKVDRQINDLYILKNVSLVHVAVGNGHNEILDIFANIPSINLNALAHERWRDKYLYLENLTPFLYAIVCNKNDMVAQMLTYRNVDKHALANGVYNNKDRLDDALGKNVYPTRTKGWSALHLAVLFANPEILQMLIAAGIDPTQKDSDGRTAYDLAIGEKKDAHRDLLKQIPKKVDIEEELPNIGKLNLGEKNSETTQAPASIAPRTAQLKTKQEKESMKNQSDKPVDDSSDSEFSAHEDNGGPDLLQAILLHATKNRYIEALKYFISKPNMIDIANSLTLFPAKGASKSTGVQNAFASFGTLDEEKNTANMPKKNLDFQSAIDTHWYTDDEVRELLEFYLQDEVAKGEVKIFYPVNPRQNHNQLLEELIDQQKLQEALAISNAVNPPRIIIMPINLGVVPTTDISASRFVGTHWTLLLLQFTDVGNREAPTIYYFDSFGSPMPEVIQRVLTATYPTAKPAFRLLDKAIQQDSYNCGVWVVEAARALVLEGRQIDQKHDINQARREHALRLNATSTDPTHLATNKQGNRPAKAQAVANQQPEVPAITTPTTLSPAVRMTKTG